MKKQLQAAARVVRVIQARIQAVRIHPQEAQTRAVQA